MTPEEIIDRNNKLYHPEMDAKYVRLEAAIKSINDYNRAFKSALREEIEKMQNECTDNGEYGILELLKEKLDSLTPKK